MQEFLNNGPVLGCSLFIFASIVYAITSSSTSAERGSGASKEQLQSEQFFMFGAIATKRFSYLVTFVGAISGIGVPIVIGRYDGLWVGVIAFFVYQLIAFFGGKILQRFGALPIIFWLAVLLTPVAIILVTFSIRIF